MCVRFSLRTVIDKIIALTIEMLAFFVRHSNSCLPQPGAQHEKNIMPARKVRAGIAPRESLCDI